MTDDPFVEIWEKSLSQSGLLPEFTACLKQKARPCFYLPRHLTEMEDYGVVGNSRMGGVPDLPRGVEWPAHRDRAMDFLMQINLGELPPGFIPELPESGWLYFFVDPDPEIWVNLPHRVLYFAGGQAELARSSPPGDQVPFRYRAYKLDFEPGYALPAQFLMELARLVGFSFHMMSVEHFINERTTLGGYALVYSGDPREYAHLKRTGFDLLLRFGRDRSLLEREIQNERQRGNAARAEFIAQRVLPLVEEYEGNTQYNEVQMNAWRPLLIIGSHEEAGMVWGDAGQLQILIYEDDLEKRIFEDTYCEVSSS